MEEERLESDQELEEGAYCRELEWQEEEISADEDEKA
jgi:hypothetical protein